MALHPADITLILPQQHLVYHYSCCLAEFFGAAATRISSIVCIPDRAVLNCICRACNRDTRAADVITSY